MAEILYNEKKGDYTLEEEIGGVKSFKNVPIKFKPGDTTSRFRKQLLKEEILEISIK